MPDHVAAARGDQVPLMKTTSYPHLSKAPIVEGLIDLQVRPRSDQTLADLARLRDDLIDRYPESKDLRTVRADVQFTETKGTSQSVATEQTGYRIERKDKPFVLLARRTGLTVSRLRPYTRWEELQAEARTVWKKYVEVSRPETVIRVATRYINRLELPAKRLDFDDYLAASPPIPKGLPQVVNEFLSRLVIPDKPSGAEIAILQSLQGLSQDSEHVHVLVDIDVYKAVDLAPTSEDIWKLLDIMRNLKNCAFFGALTKKTLGLLK